jgi:alkylhydroperoxidase family enzyme
MARIDYADPEDLPAEKRHLLDSMANDDGGGSAESATGSDDDGGDDSGETAAHGLRSDRLNVYRLLGRNPAVLAGFREYLGTVWAEAGLAPHERELVILATARAADSRYEWHQHVRVALDEGMSVDTILAVARGEPDRLAPADAALVDYATAFVAGAVDDAAHDRLTAHFDEPTVLGVAALAGNYLGLARTFDALAVDLETEFVGWDLENL